MSVIHTFRDAHCVLGLLAAGGAFVQAGAISKAIGITHEGCLVSINAVKSRLMAERTQSAFIDYKHLFGWVLIGRGERLLSLEHDCITIIAGKVCDLHNVDTEHLEATAILEARARFTRPQMQNHRGV